MKNKKKKRKPTKALVLYEAQLEILNSWKPYRYINVGRKKKITPDVVRMLEQAFSVGATVCEACMYANIGRSTFYDFLRDNPEFSDRKKELIKKPILKARMSVVADLTNVETAKWFLTKKMKKEFGDKIGVDLKHRLNNKDRDRLKELVEIMKNKENE